MDIKDIYGEEIMKIYLYFGIETYYPNGGWNDLLTISPHKSLTRKELMDKYPDIEDDYDSIYGIMLDVVPENIIVTRFDVFSEETVERKIKTWKIK